MSLRIQVTLVFLLFAFCSIGQNPLKVTSKNLSTPTTGMDLDVEFRFSDFVDIVGGPVIVLWDSTLMVVDTVTFLNSTAINGIQVALPQTNNFNPEQGQFKIDWFGGATTLPDSTHIATVRFNVVGQPCDTTAFRVGNIGPNESQKTAAFNSSFVDIGVEIEGPIVEIPGTNCDVNMPGIVGFDLINVSTTSGSNICMPLEVTNFDSIDTFGGSLSWDPALLTYIGVQSFGVTGFSTAEFNSTQAAFGSLAYFWIDNSGVSPETLADGTTLFEVCFNTIAAPGAFAQVDVVGTPTPISVTKAPPGTNPNSTVLQFTVNPGIVTVMDVPTRDPIGFSTSTISADMNTNVCLPLTVQNFEEVTTLNGSIEWDPTVLEYTGSQAYAINNFGNNNVNANTISAGNLGFVWEAIGPSATLTNGSPFMEVCFNVIGAEGTSTSINFGDRPQAFLVNQENLISGQPPVPAETNFTNGRVTVNTIVVPTDDVTFTFPDGMGDPGDNVCIPLFAEGFTDIASFDASFLWDPTVLSYTGIGDVNLPGFSAGTGLNPSQVDNGILGFNWFEQNGSGITIPANGVVLEICFEVVGAGNSITAIEMTDNPTKITVSMQPPGGGPSVGLPYILVDGSYTVNPVVTANTVIFNIADASGDCDDNVCVPITVENFTDISSVDGSFLWDPAIISYTGIGANALPGFSAGSNLNASGVDSGILGFGWFDQNGTTPLSLADGETMLELCFDVVSMASNSNSSIQMTNNPTVITVSTQPPGGGPSEELQFSINTGTFDVGMGCEIEPGDTVEFIFPELCPLITDSPVCVPLEVKGFSRISQVDFSLMWDPAIIEFVEVDEVELPGFTTMSNLNLNQLANGMLSFIWFDDTGANPVSFDDGTIIVEFCFNIVGEVNDVSAIKMFDGQSIGLTDIAIGRAGATPSDPVTPAPYSLDDGTVTIKPEVDPGDFELTISTVEINTPADLACVDMIVENFTDIIIAEWNLQWDPAKLCVRDVRNFHPNVPSLNPNFVNTTTEGILKLAWSAVPIQGQTVPPGESLFTVCFDSKMACDDSADITVLVDINPTNPRLFEVVNATNQSTALPYTFTNGGVNLVCPIDPGQPVINGVQVDDVSCNNDPNPNGAITAQFTGGTSPTTCTWTGPAGFSTQVFNNCSGSTGISNLGPGSYEVNITDAQNRTATRRFTVSEPDPIVLNPAITPVTCDANGNLFFGSISFIGANSILGGVPPYTTFPLPADLTNLNVGSYRVEITDDVGCTAVQFFEVRDECVVQSDLECSTITLTDSSCGIGGSFDVLPTGGVPFAGGQYSKTYDPPITSLTNIPPGAYCILVTDASGNTCKTPVYTIRDVTPTLGALISNIQPGNSCTRVGGSADIEFVGGCAPYNCNLRQVIGTDTLAAIPCDRATNILPGRYLLDVTDRLFNTYATEFTIPDEPISDLIVGIAANEPATCSYTGGIISFTASGACPPYSVSISSIAQPGTVVTSGDIGETFMLPAGDYRATVSDNSTMSTVQDFSISAPTAASLDELVVTDSCMISLNLSGATPPFSYEWFDGENNLVSSETILDLSSMVVNLDDTLTISDTYTINVTDSQGCTYNFTEEITCSGLMVVDTPNTNLVVTELQGSTTPCAGRQLCSGTISGNIVQGPGFSPYTLKIKDRNANEISIIVDDVGPFTFDNLCEESYTLVVTDSAGTDWFQTSNIPITAPEPLAIDISVQDCVDEDGILEVSFTGGVSPYSISWIFSGDTIAEVPRIENLTDGSYFAELVDSSGCKDTKVYDVLCDTMLPECDVYDGIPVITPNGDDINDALFINCADLGTNELRIFDRWGKLVYSVADYNNDWSGIDNDNQPLGEGSYYWVLLVEDARQSRVEKGTVTLLRNQ